MARKRQTTCGLCGVFADTTREHFVPQGLWPGPLPVRTETVPACEQCNAGSNLDDEYFRNTLAMMNDCEHPKKREVFEGPVLRSLKSHPGWVRYALSNKTVRPMRSPSGLWLGDYPVLPLDVERFSRSLRKVVKGLYFLIRKAPFPTSGEILLIGQLNPETWPLIVELEKQLFPPTFDFGDDVFEWRFSQRTDGRTLWKLMFYRTVVFYAVGTESQDDAQKTSPTDREAT